VVCWWSEISRLRLCHYLGCGGERWLRLDTARATPFTLLNLIAMDILEITNIAVAGGTSVLALFTWMAARAGQVAAKAGQLAAEATREAALASRDEATATIQLAMEAQKDRELAWRPHLGLAMTHTTPAGPTNPPLLSAQFELSNVGSGQHSPRPSGSTTATPNGTDGANVRICSYPAKRPWQPGDSRCNPLTPSRLPSQKAYSIFRPPAPTTASGCSLPPEQTCWETIGVSSTGNPPRSSAPTIPALHDGFCGCAKD